MFEILNGTTTVTTLVSFGGTGKGTKGGQLLTGVIFDSSGNLFGTTLTGSANGAGTVYEVAFGSGAITTLASFTGSGSGTNGAGPEGALIFDSSGNLFGTTTAGGAFGAGTVFMIPAVPEPSPLGVLCIGICGLAFLAKKRTA